METWAPSGLRAEIPAKRGGLLRSCNRRGYPSEIPAHAGWPGELAAGAGVKSFNPRTRGVGIVDDSTRMFCSVRVFLESQQRGVGGPAEAPTSGGSKKLQRAARKIRPSRPTICPCIGRANERDWPECGGISAFSPRLRGADAFIELSAEQYNLQSPHARG